MYLGVSDVCVEKVPVLGSLKAVKKKMGRIIKNSQYTYGKCRYVSMKLVKRQFFRAIRNILKLFALWFDIKTQQRSDVQ